MLVSYVLRLVPEELASGRLVGEIEDVGTGERRPIHGAEELLGFCRDSFRHEQPAPRTPRIKAEG